MKASQAGQASARLAVVNDKIQAAYVKALATWFSAQFVKGIKLPLLQDVYRAGAYPAFSQLLSECSDADRLMVLKKVDPNLPDAARSKSDLMAHLESLASGRTAPSGKIRPPKPSKPAKKKQVGILSTSKY